MAVSVQLYGSESRITKQRNENNIQSAELRFLRRVKGWTISDQIRSENMQEELNVYDLNEKIENTG